MWGCAAPLAHLAERFRCDLDFHSCTVFAMEQLTLAHFIENGDFEWCGNRMRCRRHAVRDALGASGIGSRATVGFLPAL